MHGLLLIFYRSIVPNIPKLYCEIQNGGGFPNLFVSADSCKREVSMLIYNGYREV